MEPPAFRGTPAFIGWHAGQAPAATAVIENGVRISYAEMARDLVGCAAALRGCGLRPGLLAGVEIRPDRYLHLVLLLACEMCGVATTSFLAADLHGADPVLPDCDLLLVARAGVAPGALVIPADFLLSVRAGAVPSGVLDDGYPGERVLRIARTSGTTGRPKAIAASRELMGRIIAQYMQRVPAAVRAGPRMLCLYNFGVRACYTRVMGVLRDGGTVLFAMEEQAAMILAAGMVNYVPLMVGDAERIMAHLTPPAAGHTRLIDLIGARAGPALARMIRSGVAGSVSLRYSSNETGIIADMDPDNVGTVADGAAVRIVDGPGRDLPMGQTGMILVRTDTMVDSYVNDPEQTRAAFVDGWYRTNDMGYMPEPGRLVVVGRADDIVNIGGIKVAATALEDAIEVLPGVGAVAVLHVRPADRADILLVALEAAGAQGLAALRERIGLIVQRHVRQFELMVLPNLPRTATGKIRRTEIRAAYLRTRQFAGG